jgi:RHS repeat-associated protein
MIRSAWLTLLLLTLLGLAPQSQAVNGYACANRPSAPFYACFLTVGAAEAFLREEETPAVGRPFLVRQDKAFFEGLQYVSYHYHVPFRAHEAGPFESYIHANYQGDNGRWCLPGPEREIGTIGCQTEGEIAQLVLEGWPYDWDPGGYSASFIGSYAPDPPAAWGGFGPYVGVSRNVSPGDRSLLVSGNGVTESWNPVRDDYYQCSNLFYAVGSGGSHVPPSPRWPLTCYNGQGGFIRFVSNKHANMCEGNPCVPATGAKEYSHVDFQWSGMSFKRHYNSLDEIPLASNMGDSWAHNFSFKLTHDTYNNYVVLVGSDGYIEGFRNVAATQYVSENVQGQVITSLPAGSDESGATWKLSRVGGEHLYFSTQGLLLRIDTGEQQYLLDYCTLGQFQDGLCDAPSLLSKVTDRRGRALTLRYASLEIALGGNVNATHTLPRLTSILSDDGPLVDYSYDGMGRLVAATFPDDQSPHDLTYLYGESDHLCRTASGSAIANCDPTQFPTHMTGVIDELNVRVADYSYDNRGRVTISEHSGGAKRVTLDYQSASTVRVTQPTGGATVYTFDSSILRKPLSVRKENADGSVAYQKNQVFDDRYRLISRKEENNSLTTFGYDDYRRTSTTEGLTSTGATQAVTRTTSTTWDNALNRMTSREVGDQRTRWAHNSRGQTTATCQVDVNVPAASTYTCGASVNAPAGVRQTRSTFCEAADVAAVNSTCPILGLVKAVNGPRTDVSDISTYTYYPADAANCASQPTSCSYRKGDLWKVTNAKAQVTEFLAYDGAGRVLQQMDANNVVTDLEYHPRGWMTRRIVRGSDPASELDDAITRIDYFPTGLVQRVTQPDGAHTDYTYDAAHRLTAITDALGNRMHYTLDAAGNRTKEESFDPSQALTRELARTYTTLGQLQTIIDGNEQTLTTHTYDASGDLDTSTDALGRVQDHTVDPLGRLIASISNANGSGVERAETGYSYDAVDRLRTVTDPNGLTTTYTYNSLGDLLTLVSPDTGTTQYTVDAAGNRKTQTDARGITHTYVHDVLGRLTTLTPPTAAQKVTFVYDVPTANCLAGETFGKGRLARMTDETGNTRYCYDGRGQLVRRVQIASGGPTRTVQASYTSAGRLDTLTYPSGATTRYLRDSQGRTIGIMGKPTAAASEISLVNSATYLPFGPLDSLTFGNGRLQSRSFDLNYGIDEISDNGAANDAFFIDFQLDTLGNVVALDELQGTQSVLRDVDYDGQNRLTALKAGAQLIEGFAYDATGNRTQRSHATTTTPYTTATGSHRLESVGLITRGYDAAGNTAAINEPAPKTLTYNDHGRLREVRISGTLQAGYRYNGRGERIVKLHPTNTNLNRYFVYADDGKLLGEYNKNGTRVAEFVWLDDTLVAIYADHDASTYQFVQTDHLGTPRAVIHPSRDRIVWRWDLTVSAFGDHAPVGDPDGDSKAYVMNLRYPGQYFDAESGPHYNYFRDYDPATGRYVGSDPIGLGGGWNTYAYAMNNPWSYIDPMGLAIWIVGHSAGGSLGTVTNPDAYHLALYLNPSDCECGSDEWPITLGGQPSFSISEGLNLISSFNNPGDAVTHATFIRDLAVPPGETECSFAGKLLAAARAYGNNLDYSFPNISPVPGVTDGGMSPGRYNSNSYVSGVIEAAGGDSTIPYGTSPVQVPGYGNPMPTP